MGGGGGQEGPIAGLSQPQEVLLSELFEPPLLLLSRPQGFCLQPSSRRSSRQPHSSRRECSSPQKLLPQQPRFPKKLLPQQLKRMMSKNKEFIGFSPFSLLHYILLIFQSAYPSCFNPYSFLNASTINGHSRGSSHFFCTGIISLRIKRTISFSPYSARSCKSKSRAARVLG